MNPTKKDNTNLEKKNDFLLEKKNDKAYSDPQDKTKPYSVRANVTTFVERLDEEYIKALQKIDPHTTEYVDRLRDEGVIYNLICVCENYLRALPKENKASELPIALIRRVEHIYYKVTSYQSPHSVNLKF